MKAGSPPFYALFLSLSEMRAPHPCAFARVGRDAVDRIIVVMPLSDSRGQSPQCDQCATHPSQKAAKDGAPTVWLRQRKAGPPVRENSLRHPCRARSM